MVQMVSFPGLGVKFELNRVAFRLGNLPIYWYGILIALGFVLAILYTTRRAKEFGVDQDRLIDVILGGAIGGIVGARAYYVIFQWDYYSQNLSQIFNTRSGGMAIYGGIIGGLLVGALMCRIRRVRFWPAADLVAGGFLIGQSIGRWGNFVNIEAFGANTSLPWGMTAQPITDYLLAHETALEALGMNIDPHMPVHPTFLYESIWCALGFLLLMLYTKHRKFDGEITLFYLAWYGAGRAVIEGLRTDSLLIPGTGLRASQVLAVLLVVVALAIWVSVKIKIKKTDDPASMRLFVTTEEAAQIAAGTFYPTKGKPESIVDKPVANDISTLEQPVQPEEPRVEPATDEETQEPSPEPEEQSLESAQNQEQEIQKQEIQKQEEV